MRNICLNFVIAILSVLAAHGQTCAEITAAAEMARARSTTALLDASKHAGEGYRSRFVRAFRSFQLQPRSKESAIHLLELIPAGDEQQKTVMTLGDSLCEEESLADMKALAQVNEGLAREVARAVLLVPTLLPRYLEYATVAVQDPHSAYAVEMKRVCRALGADFSRAVEQLPGDKKRVFGTQVMNPSGCKPLAIPEGER